MLSQGPIAAPYSFYKYHIWSRSGVKQKTRPAGFVFPAQKKFDRVPAFPYAILVACLAKRMIGEVSTIR